MTPGGRAVLRRAAVVAATGVALGGAWLDAGPASAHTGLVRTLPADGAAATGGPLEVVLTFLGTVDPDLAVVLVRGPDGDLPAAGPVQVRDGVVTQPLAAASRAGDHVVRYRVVGADGHPISGEPGFSLVPGPAPAQAGPRPAPSAAGGPAGSGTTAGSAAAGDEAPGPAAVAGVAVAVLAVAGGALGLRRRVSGRGPGG